MSRSYDVLIEQQNGCFRATVPSLPGVTAEAASQDEALKMVWRQAEIYLKTVEVATIEVEVPAERLRHGSAQAGLRAAAACRVDTEDPLQQEYLAQLEAEDERQRQEAKEEAEIAASEFPLAEAWARAAGLKRQDPNDPVYQSYLATLAAAKQQEREEARREAE